MSRKIVAGNWKMNKTFQEAKALVDELNQRVDEIPGDVKLLIAPPTVYLSTIASELNQRIGLSAQNCTDQDFGAFTGEVSADMLKSIGIGYSIIGHSERRSYYGDTDEWISRKVKSLVSKGMVAIFCCGESPEERESGNHFDVVGSQIERALFDLNVNEMMSVVIAYEPVWAIGTGVTASKEQAQEMHSYIRKLITEKFGQEIGEKTSILYGGSCKPSNASELFAQGDIDGGLIGGASLNADDFLAIAKANK